ncbi:hypothetical protein EYF80_004597 [Liparis tanakae]|uniref:Uncharacterized protein n=1 Tax=Liparis tanakae TaxID=230148 RepID=A0A4Z2J5F7_9TELE|nr:hypothetical protein EYF80_004597 [Liparis tanakae]
MAACTTTEREEGWGGRGFGSRSAALGFFRAFTGERDSAEQILHGDGRQVGVEVALVVSASEHQQGASDGRGRALPREAPGAGCVHGDDGVPRPGDAQLRERQLRERHLRPAVGV